MSKKDDEIIEILDSFCNKMEEATRHQAAFIVCQEKNDIEKMKECLDDYDMILTEVANMENVLRQVSETIRNDSSHYSKSTFKQLVTCIDELTSSTASFKAFSRVAHNLSKGGN